MFYLNNHKVEYMAASGALAFHGKGWPWERLLVLSGLIDLKDLTIVAKTVTFEPRVGNLKLYHPWTCVRSLGDGSVVNKVGLTNPGYEWWIKNVGQKVDRRKISLVGSIFGNKEEILKMIKPFNSCDLAAMEANVSCPNTGHDLIQAQEIVGTVKEVIKVSRHPVIVKVSMGQDYLSIARGLRGIVSAISFNSVPWEIAFPGKRSPLWKLEQKVGGGGGGVSGKAAQPFNWKAMKEIHAEFPELPLIASSIMEQGDLKEVREMGASAVSFGTRFIWTPWVPSQMIKKDKQERGIS